MQPQLHLHWPAIVAAVAAAFVFGGAWYGPLFGKTWAGLMGMPADFKPAPDQMRKSMILQLVGTFLTTYVLAHSVQVWRPSAWGVGADSPSHVYGFFGGFFTWVGFYIPLQLGKVSWENRPWKLFFINAGHDFINLQIIAQILACWR